jgi:hypothetical protein
MNITDGLEKKQNPLFAWFGPDALLSFLRIVTWII